MIVKEFWKLCTHLPCVISWTLWHHSLETHNTKTQSVRASVVKYLHWFQGIQAILMSSWYYWRAVPHPMWNDLLILVFLPLKYVDKISKCWCSYHHFKLSCPCTWHTKVGTKSLPKIQTYDYSHLWLSTSWVLICNRVSQLKIFSQRWSL